MFGIKIVYQTHYVRLSANGKNNMESQTNGNACKRLNDINIFQIIFFEFFREKQTFIRITFGSLIMEKYLQADLFRTHSCNLSKKSEQKNDKHL